MVVLVVVVVAGCEDVVVLLLVVVVVGCVDVVLLVVAVVVVGCDVVVLVVEVVVDSAVVVVVVGPPGPTTWRVYALLTVALAASVACTVKMKSPLTVGVPDKTPGKAEAESALR